MEKNWTTGSVLQSIWRFSLPYLLSYFYRRYTVWQIY